MLFGVIKYFIILWIGLVVCKIFSVSGRNDTNKAHQKRWVEKVLLIQQKENNDE